MYVFYKSKNILTLVTIGYIVGFIVGMYIEYCLWAQVAILDIYCIYWTVWDRYMQVLFLGRAPRTKETLPDFLKWRRVTRPPLVFRRLTGSQRTPGFWGVTIRTQLGVVFGDVFGLFWVFSLISRKMDEISKNLGKLQGPTSRRRDPTQQRRPTPRRGRDEAWASLGYAVA